MSIEVTDELLTLVKDYEYYGTDIQARHLADYICSKLEEAQRRYSRRHQRRNTTEFNIKEVK